MIYAAKHTFLTVCDHDSDTGSCLFLWAFVCFVALGPIAYNIPRVLLPLCLASMARGHRNMVTLLIGCFSNVYALPCALCSQTVITDSRILYY